MTDSFHENSREVKITDEEYYKTAACSVESCCPVCYFEYFQCGRYSPKVLRCGHIICNSCFHKVEFCPICREELYGPKKDFKDKVRYMRGSKQCIRHKKVQNMFCSLNQRELCEDCSKTCPHAQVEAIRDVNSAQSRTEAVSLKRRQCIEIYEEVVKKIKLDGIEREKSNKEYLNLMNGFFDKSKKFSNLLFNAASIPAYEAICAKEKKVEENLELSLNPSRPLYVFDYKITLQEEKAIAQQAYEAIDTTYRMIAENWKPPTRSDDSSRLYYVFDDVCDFKQATYSNFKSGVLTLIFSDDEPLVMDEETTQEFREFSENIEIKITLSKPASAEFNKLLYCALMKKSSKITHAELTVTDSGTESLNPLIDIFCKLVSSLTYMRINYDERKFIVPAYTLIEKMITTNKRLSSILCRAVKYQQSLVLVTFAVDLKRKVEITFELPITALCSSETKFLSSPVCEQVSRVQFNINLDGIKEKDLNNLTILSDFWNDINCYRKLQFSYSRASCISDLQYKRIKVCQFLVFDVLSVYDDIIL